LSRQNFGSQYHLLGGLEPSWAGRVKTANVMGVGTTGSSECSIGSHGGHIVVIEGYVNEGEEAKTDVRVGASMRQGLGMV